MKCFSIIMVSLLLVAISLVSSNEMDKEDQSLNRVARAANGGKGKYLLHFNIFALFYYKIEILFIKQIQTATMKRLNGPLVTKRPM